MKNNVFFLSLILFLACEKADPILEVTRPTSWTETSHSKGITPALSIVLPENKVNEITIKLDTSAWNAVKNDMKARTGRAFGGAVDPNIKIPPPEGILDAVSGDPVFVKATMYFENKVWENIGFRLKGNASLSSTWRSGNYKMPFKLKFDEFENSIPNIIDQRFYGFQELSFSPNFADPSFLKDRLVSELFREGGVPACRMAYYAVNIDLGDGPKYFGVYTVIESVADTFIKTQFKDNKGNVYKPESDFKTMNTARFEKQNNTITPDFSDVSQFISALNSSSRISNKKEWKKQLEKVFDVQHFLNWMAINNTIVNWDTYGVLAHNYYLFNCDGLIKFIPYDHNLSMQFRGGANNARFAISLDLKELTEAWPLMKFLGNDPDYYQDYKKYISKFTNKHLVPNTVNAKIDKYQKMLQPYVIKEVPGYSHMGNSTNFFNSISEIKTHLSNRFVTAREFSK